MSQWVITYNLGRRISVYITVSYYVQQRSSNIHNLYNSGLENSAAITEYPFSSHWVVTSQLASLDIHTWYGRGQLGSLAGHPFALGWVATAQLRPLNKCLRADAAVGDEAGDLSLSLSSLPVGSSTASVRRASLRVRASSSVSDYTCPCWSWPPSSVPLGGSVVVCIVLKYLWTNQRLFTVLGYCPFCCCLFFTWWLETDNGQLV